LTRIKLSKARDTLFSGLFGAAIGTTELLHYV
jgi:hypothetical protein